MFQSPGSIALSLGKVDIQWYGVIIASGILLAYWYVSAELRRRKLEQEPVDQMAVWLILSGVIGARLYYVLFSWEHYSANLGDIFMIWKGGLAIHGALLGGAIAYFIFTKVKKISWTEYADILLPAVLFAQALGRWGNFFNSEAFGGPTNLPWKLFIPTASRPQGFENIEFYHPTFLYESLWNVAGFVLLVLLARAIYKAGSKTPTGIITAGYLMWYSFGRFFVEAMRTDSLYLGSFRIAQVVSVILFTVGLIGLLVIFKKRYNDNPHKGTKKPA